ncbi:alpha/beta hydrolase family protein [Quisquiliibacterium transsilvanicum]|uniref:Putative alpha/beta hydrolase n=1 Tax=Quisquiliibacterium transsilvanicum TaxID=1549638 RepID=A0A7W8M985_9BURK|nr:alpha/beta fold hydrolase [Quisquiliibacterium transsilvanicum]MBB5271799.1 putative alpha/beta hydrolase [Quisquiliibacterium transsilvanicum]
MAAGLRLELSAGDGSSVVAHRFDAAAPAGVVVIGAALAVPQAFYFDFAAWLAQQGFTALTFDYRGVGHAAPRSLRGFRANIDDWIRHDYEAVVVEARRLAGGRPLTVVGHSMGAQLVPLLPSAREVDAMVAVAGGSGHWRGFMPPMWPFMLAMHHVAVPVALPVAGYFPGRRLKMIGDLPSGVMRQWRRWCLHPDYLVGVEPGAREAYARAAFPMLSLSFTDDRMMPQRNVEALHAHLPGVRRETRRFSPADAGGPIGHMGFFRRRYRDSLWPVALDWIAARRRGAEAT